MKIAVFLFCFCLVSLSSADTGGPTPSTEGATLTLGFDNLPDLLAKLSDQKKESDEKKSELSVETSLLRSDYILTTVSDSVIRGEATFTAVNLTDKEMLIPICVSGLAVTQIEPESAILVPQEGKLCLLAEGKGIHKVTVSFQLSAVADGLHHLVCLPTTSGVVNGANLENYTVKGDLSAVALSSEGAKLMIRKKRDGVESSSQWSGKADVVYKVEDDEVKGNTLLQLMAGAEDSGLFAEFVLPRDTRIVAVDGADLESWKMSQKDGVSHLKLAWSSAGVTRRRVTVHFAVPLPDLEELWKAEGFRLTNEGGTQTRIALVASGEREFFPVADVSRATMTSWFREKGASVIWNVKGERSLELKSRVLTTLKTAKSRVQEAWFATQLIADGSALTDSKVVISHSEADRFTFTLPTGTSLLSCEVNGERVNPLVVEKDALSVQLPLLDTKKDSQSVVKVSYTVQRPKMNPVSGRLDLALPETAIFIDQLNWDITLPSGYVASALEGNLELRPDGKKKGVIGLRKRLSRAQVPSTTVFYEKVQ